MTRFSTLFNYISVRLLLVGVLGAGICLAAEMNTPVTLRLSIQHLQDISGASYPKGDAYLSCLETIAARMQSPDAALKEQAKKDFITLQRAALTAHPMLKNTPILFSARQQYLGDHHNTATMFQTDEYNTRSYRGGGALKLLDLKTGAVTTLVDAGKEGIARDPEVSFDGASVVFSMRTNILDNYHIYTVQSNGTGLQKLTSAKGVADIDPLYLPDGGIVFTSTREPKYCMCNRHIMGNLFRMDNDGANIHQIGKSTLHEGHSALMPDGRIIYDRWEYVDRNFGNAQGVWSVNPDGTYHALVYGNNTLSPGAVIDSRSIPGTQRLICIFSSCHDRPWGALAIIDRRNGVEGKEPVVRTWPTQAIDRVCRGGIDMFKGVNPKYEDPYPLDDSYFLVSRMTGTGENMGIFLVDLFGNEIQLHSDEKGCFDPMPLARKELPPVIPARRDYTAKPGRFYIQDVYAGTHMAGVKKGSVKYLRVIESPEKRFWTGPGWNGEGIHCPAMNWHSFENKRILGTVPVEPDGSVYVEVPADTFVYFQLLDENEMMIQSMRSATIIQPGEIQGCIGCHDARHAAPALKSLAQPLAFNSPPHKLNGWYGPARIFSYQEEVQPVFDKHCVKCHDFGRPAGKKLNLAGDRTLSFNASYIDLWSKKQVAAIGGGPAEIQQAYSWGSHPSKLVKVLQKGHKKIKLSKEEMNRIITWIDLNAIYYPSYASAYPNNPFGRSPISGRQLKELRELTSARIVSGHGPGQFAQVSFRRPELSPCLKNIQDKKSPEYKQALEIIRQGAKQLKKTPRADMHGFIPAKKDQQRQVKYEQRQQAEQKSRKALRTGVKVYD